MITGCVHTYGINFDKIEYFYFIYFPALLLWLQQAFLILLLIRYNKGILFYQGVNLGFNYSF